MAQHPWLHPQRVLICVVVIAWVTLALSSPWQAIADDSSPSVAWAVITWSWILWTGVAAALLVPSPMSLTITRIVVPLSIVVSILAGEPLAVFCSVLALVVCA